MRHCRAALGYRPAYRAINCMRIGEFFEDYGGSKSMGRLLAFMGFWPATYKFVHTNNVEYMKAYLIAYGACYLLGKGFDMMRRCKDDDAAE